MQSAAGGAENDHEGKKSPSSVDNDVVDEKGRTLTGVKEGSATVYFPPDSPEEVFYNPVQEFNRDLSIAVIEGYLNKFYTPPVTEKKCRILEALSATGLRSIRYAKEIQVPADLEIKANDISRRAYDSIVRNVEANGVSGVVLPNHSDATMVMYGARRTEDRFDVVDLDPYGSPNIFLDGAVQSVAEGGLLCVTATDMAVLAGNSPESCYTKYGAISLKSKSCHEIGLRIMLQCIESHANRYGRYVEPLLSMSIDFYIRVFVRVFTSQKKCKKTTSKLGHVYQCTGCESLTISPLGKVIEEDKNVKYKLVTGPPVDRRCRFCQKTFQVGGPIWTDPIHNVDFVRSLLDRLTGSGGREESVETQRFGTQDRMVGMLSVVAEELPDVPLYYSQDRLYSMIKLGSNKFTLIRSALLNAGYRVSLSHANKLAIKTDAPNEFIWRMMRALVAKEPTRKADDKKASSVSDVTYNLRREPVDVENAGAKSETSTADENSNGSKLSEINFELHPDANPESRLSSLKRFQPNPLPNWGPKMKAHTTQADMDRKRKQNQGKHALQKRQKRLNEVGEQGANS